MRERDAERGRRRLHRVRDRERHERAGEDEAVHGDAAQPGQLLDEAVVAARLRERARGGGAELGGRARKAHGALAAAVRRLDDDREAELGGGARRLGGRAAGDRPRLREAGRREPLALAQAGDGERGRLRLQRVRQAEPLRDAGRDADGVVGAGRDEPVDLLGAREPVDRRLVLDRHDRPPVGVAEPGGGRVAVGRDEGQAAAAGRGQDPELGRAGAENEQTHRPIVATVAAMPLPIRAPAPPQPANAAAEA